MFSNNVLIQNIQFSSLLFCSIHKASNWVNIANRGRHVAEASSVPEQTGRLHFSVSTAIRLRQVTEIWPMEVGWKLSTSWGDFLKYLSWALLTLHVLTLCSCKVPEDCLIHIVCVVRICNFYCKLLRFQGLLLQNSLNYPNLDNGKLQFDHLIKTIKLL